MEWEKHEQQQLLLLHRQNHQQLGIGNGNDGGVMYVKVMTDDQLETLRKQIAVYASICERLVEMHKTLASQQDLPGMRLGNFYCDPSIISAGHKISSRQRWTPTPVQLQTLERIFAQGTGIPTKQKIKEMTTELSEHGQISETNVYNWFQNRRARSRRKQHVSGTNNAESEVETEVDSPKQKKMKPENLQSGQNLAARAEDLCFQSPEISSDMHFYDHQINKVESMFPSDGGLMPARSSGQMPFYDGVLSNPRNNHLTGKMELPGSYNPYDCSEDYSMTG